MTPSDANPKPDKWEPLRSFEVGGREYHLSEIEIQQQIEIHDLREKLWALEVKHSGRVKWFLKMMKELGIERDDFLIEIRELHFKYLKKDCDTCEGDGWIPEARTCDYPSSHDPMVPAERMEKEICEDCKGTGKEWVSA